MNNGQSVEFTFRRTRNRLVFTACIPVQMGIPIRNVAAQMQLDYDVEIDHDEHDYNEPEFGDYDEHDEILDGSGESMADFPSDEDDDSFQNNDDSEPDDDDGMSMSSISSISPLSPTSLNGDDEEEEDEEELTEEEDDSSRYTDDTESYEVSSYDDTDSDF